MELLIVDGYNVAHAWAQTKSLLNTGAPLEDVRRVLVSRLSAYAATTDLRIVVVFDAPSRRGVASADPPAGQVIDGVEVRFGGGAFGSADHVIERLVYHALRPPATERVRVVTADRLIRDMVRAMGADTLDPATLETEIDQSHSETQSRIGRLRQEAGFARRVEHGLPSEVRAHLEALRRGHSPSRPDESGPLPEPSVTEVQQEPDPGTGGDIGSGAADTRAWQNPGTSDAMPGPDQSRQT